MRDTLLIIHVLAAGTWIGGSATVLFLSRRMGSSGAETGRSFMAGFEKMGRMYFPPAAIVLLLTGILMVTDSNVFEFKHAFVIIGIAVVIIGAVLGARVFDPLAKRAQQAHADGDEGALASVYARFRAMGALDLLLLVIAVMAMVTKFGV